MDGAHAAGAGAGAGAGAYVLVVGEDKLLTRSLPAAGELVLGRDPDCALPLLDARISRRHARLVVAHGEVTIEDIGSTNGIKVNGARLARGRPVRLPFGDSVRLGPFTLIVLGNRPAVTDDGAGQRAAVVVRDPSVAGKTELLERIARHGVGVLIHGETGTGKEVLARTLHALSQRPGELLAINCAALTGTLLESELFGYEKGAFTGAARSKPGLLEVAGAGSVLLDEIGDLPLELQGKLLRALEARQVYRVGGLQPVALHARIIAASHRSLPDLIARGAFREDLYFRLNGITLELLPLRERRSQIPTLAHEFLAVAARSAGHPTPSFTPAALALLAQYDWPGNVRELRLVVERAALLAGASTIDARHVLLEARPPRVAEPDARGRPDARDAEREREGDRPRAGDREREGDPGAWRERGLADDRARARDREREGGPGAWRERGLTDDRAQARDREGDGDRARAGDRERDGDRAAGRDRGLADDRASASEPEPQVNTREQFLAIAREHRGNASAIARALSTSRSQVRRLAARFSVDLDELRRG